MKSVILLIMNTLSSKRQIFLTAKWEYLVMLNYALPEHLLLPYLPKGTQLDLFQGKAMASIVGFLFNQTKVLGVKWPSHSNFEEVNYRFYIKYFDGKQWKRGVAFISEIVPKFIITKMANSLYNEHYSTMPMRHKIHIEDQYLHVEYQWKQQHKLNSLSVKAINTLQPILPNSEEEFIFEHYWGYNQLNQTTLIEYGVEHQRWEVYPVTSYTLDADISSLYGQSFVPYLSVPPNSIFLARGSDIIVRRPHKIKLM